MAQFLQMDPVKRDYVVPNGSPIPSDRIEERAFFALAIPRLNYIYGSEHDGSDLYLFENAKKIPETDRLYATRATQALNDQLVARGDATAVQVRNLSSTRTGTSNQIDIQPNQKSISTALSFTPV